MVKLRKLESLLVKVIQVRYKFTVKGEKVRAISVNKEKSVKCFENSQEISLS